MLAGLRQRTLDLTRGRYAEPVLWAISFAESSFFPLPPDLMLGPMAAADRSRWLRYALGCTIASVLGGLLGYAIGYYLFDTVGEAILSFFGYGGRVEALRAEYDRLGLWIIFAKGLTPIPFKLVTIVSGAMHFSLPMFVFGCIVTRGLRFIAVAWIFQRYGEQIAPVIERRLGLILLGVFVALIGVILAAHFLH